MWVCIIHTFLPILQGRICNILLCVCVYIGQNNLLNLNFSNNLQTPSQQHFQVNGRKPKHLPKLIIKPEENHHFSINGDVQTCMHGRKQQEEQQ